MEVPNVADGQQNDADVSVVTTGMSRALLRRRFFGYRIRTNETLLENQRAVRPSSIRDHLWLKMDIKARPYPKRIDPGERYIFHSAGIVHR